MAALNLKTRCDLLGRHSTTVPESLEPLRQVQVRQQVIERLIAGNLSLGQAAREFYAQRPRNWLEGKNPVAKAVPTADDNEWELRTILGWVQLALADRPEQAESVLARLEGELQLCLRQVNR